MLNNHILLGVVWKKSFMHKILSDDMTEISRTLVFRAQLRKKNQLKRLRRNSYRRQSRIKSEWYNRCSGKRFTYLHQRDED